MANQRFALPRRLASLAALGVGIFLAGCSPTVDPAASGAAQAGKQTAELVTWLTDAQAEADAAAAASVQRSDADAPAKLHLMTARAPKQVDAPAKAAGHPVDGSCDKEPYTVPLAAQTVSTATIASDTVPSEKPAYEIDTLIDFLYGLPRSNGGHGIYEGDL